MFDDKKATLIFINNITEDPTNMEMSLDYLQKYVKYDNMRELKFKSDDSKKCECYQYLCDTMTNDDKSVGGRMIKVFRILDMNSKSYTNYLLKSMRIGTYGFNKEFNINTNDTLTRSKLNKVLSDIARITSETNIDYIKMECDDVKWSRDQYNNMLK